MVCVAIAASVAATIGCAEDGVEGAGGGSDQQVVVSAAASLEPAFTAYADTAGFDAKQSFAGSDELAAQIRQGVKPDVYAAANTSLPEELYAEELVTKPVVFASNDLVLAVPADSPIGSLEQIAAPGIPIAIGDMGVPVGDYTREVLSRLDSEAQAAILDNVRSQEPDVAGIVGKLTQGAVDAGFVYVTDVVATDGELEAIELPAELQPRVAYAAAVVEGAQNPEGAQEFVDGLLEGTGAEELEEAGFGPVPRE